MEEQKYVIAIALAEQNNKRLMPLGGKTFAGVDTLIEKLKSICSNLWSVKFQKHEGILFNNLKNRN